MISPQPFQASAAQINSAHQSNNTYLFIKVSSLMLLATLCCTGCILSYSVSGRTKFRPYIGQTVTLTRPLLLVECHSALFSSYGIKSLGYARYALAEPQSAWGPGPIFAKLPKGYPLVVNSVHEEITGDNAVEVVYGYVVNPTIGERASFAYECYESTLPWQLTASSR